MPGTDKRTFSLPSEHAAYIDAKVKSGRYASGSEVIRAGLRALQERDDAVENWLRNEVAEIHDGVKEGRISTHKVGDVFDDIRAHHAAMTDKQ